MRFVPTRWSWLAVFFGLALGFSGAPPQVFGATPPWENHALGPSPIYMILMNDQFAANAKLGEFADWKQRKGYTVRMVLTSQIRPDGAPQAAEIVDFMRGLSESEYPAYLLILGNSSVSNGVAGVLIRQSPYFQGGFF